MTFGAFDRLNRITENQSWTFEDEIAGRAHAGWRAVQISSLDGVAAWAFQFRIEIAHRPKVVQLLALPLGIAQIVERFQFIAEDFHFTSRGSSASFVS